MRMPRRPRRQGFSLIELMVALAVAGILAAIAYPAYTSQLQRGRRADAIAALSAVMQAQERFRSNVSNYASSLNSLNINISDITPHYQVSLSGVGNPAAFSTGYIATATPVPGGKQARDSACKSFTVTLNRATPTYTALGDPDNSGSDRDTRALCWPN
ncbi:type IV pilin protein [Roseateles sp.]|uniref:type IV pilin protein n=1 Tax=Roseateles sp. TaxID=1971397 RepID=UPI0025D36428|nr:type IV pilin protein [Roseateles sp.]